MHDLAHTYDVEERQSIVDTPDVRVHTMQLAPSQSVPWHKHTSVDDTFVCLSGQMAVWTDDAEGEAVFGPGGMLTVKAGVSHFVTPLGSSSTKFLLIQATGAHDYIPVNPNDLPSDS